MKLEKYFMVGLLGVLGIFSQSAFAVCNTQYVVNVCMITDNAHNATRASVYNGSSKTITASITVYGRKGSAPKADDVIYSQTRTIASGGTKYTDWFGGTVGKTYKATVRYVYSGGGTTVTISSPTTTLK